VVTRFGAAELARYRQHRVESAVRCFGPTFKALILVKMLLPTGMTPLATMQLTAGIANADK